MWFASFITKLAALVINVEADPSGEEVPHHSGVEVLHQLSNPLCVCLCVYAQQNKTQQKTTITIITPQAPNKTNKNNWKHYKNNTTSTKQNNKKQNVSQEETNEEESPRDSMVDTNINETEEINKKEGPDTERDTIWCISPRKMQ